jgi:DNA-binding FadR family transcriptional regulator
METVERRPLAQQVVERLRALLGGEEFPVGARLPTEPELMARFGVGRSTVREAVRVLAHLGLVEVRQGDGTYVRAAAQEGDAEPLAARLRRARLAEVYQVRGILEPAVAELAAANRDEDDLARLRALLDQEDAARAAGNAADRIEAALAFHRALADATHNRVLADLYRAISPVLAELADAPEAQAAMSHRCGEGIHRAVLAAVEAGAADQARAITADVTWEPGQAPNDH